MDCWDRFDRKTVLYFTGNKNSRVPGMERELERVGLGDADRQWQFPSPIDRVLLNGMNHIKQMDRNGYFNCTMGHYRAIATAYHLGCSSVLIMEDDVRFLAELDELESVVGSMPSDFDVAMLDCFFQDDRPGRVNGRVMSEWRDRRKKNEHWSEFDALYSCGCYALSKKAMKRMLFLYEAVETDRKIGKMRICDHFMDRSMLGRDMKLYFARKNAAIQRTFGGSNSNAGDITRKYVEMGLDLSKYAEA